MKVIYNYYDGTSYLLFYDNEERPEGDWTEVAPPPGIYEPYYFDGEKWIGTSREDYEKNNPPDPYKPTHGEIQQAQTQMQVAESSYQLRETQQKLAETMMDNAEKDKVLKNLEQQQAQVLLELAEIKGGK